MFVGGWAEGVEDLWVFVSWSERQNFIRWLNVEFLESFCKFATHSGYTRAHIHSTHTHTLTCIVKHCSTEHKLFYPILCNSLCTLKLYRMVFCLYFSTTSSYYFCYFSPSFLGGIITAQSHDIQNDFIFVRRMLWLLFDLMASTEWWF